MTTKTRIPESPSTGEATATRGPTISVIIPALNAEKTIGRCLESLCSMHGGVQDFEVILVDNGSRDRTLEIASGFTARLNLRILQRPGVYISELRNSAAKLARGKILAFLDADCVPPPTWINEFLSRLETAPDAVIGAHYKVPPASSWLATAWYGGMESNRAGAVSYIPGGDLIIKRADFFAVGGFDESIQTNEDAELCRRARLRGLRVVAFPELAVDHLGTPQTLSSFFRKQRWQGTHVFKVFLRERGSHNAKPVALAMYTLVALFGVVAGLILWVTKQHYHLLAASVSALVAAPAATGVLMAAKRKRMAQAGALAMLTLIYALARSLCLLDIRSWLLKKQVF